MSYIINLSFSNGTFPDKLKIAKVVPLYKGGDKSVAKNYRPISILPIFDKIIERLMHDRLLSFLSKYKLINPTQYGFQKHKSTTHAIIDVLTKINATPSSNKVSCCVFLDLAKAFDTVNHTILLSKLWHYGIRGKQNDWFRSYLSNRKQCVSINNSLSTAVSMSHGVPQGSILGPLLFILYINDIFNASNKLKITQLADDTCAYLDKVDTSLNTTLKMT